MESKEQRCGGFCQASKLVLDRRVTRPENGTSASDDTVFPLERCVPRGQIVDGLEIDYERVFTEVK